MAKGELVVGLDIGTTKVCTLIAEVDERGGATVLGIGNAPSTGVRRGVVVDVEETVAAITASVEQAQRMAGATVRSVLVGVTGEHIASLNSRGVVAITHPDREVTAADLERVLTNARFIVLPPDREIIHVIPRQYSLDGHGGIRSPVGMCGTRLEVEAHIVTGTSTFLRNLAACVERAHLSLEEMVLEPIATGEAVLQPVERDLGVAVLDIGGGTSDLAIFRGGEICFSAVVPVGGEYITRDLAAGLRTTLEEAERLKRAFGAAQAEAVPAAETVELALLGAGEKVSLPRRQLAQIVEARVGELLELVERELARSGYDRMLPGGLVLAGGGALLSGLPDAAQARLGMPVRLGKPGGPGGLGSVEESPAQATAVGLVLWGARNVPASARREPTGFFENVVAWMRRLLAG